MFTICSVYYSVSNIGIFMNMRSLPSICICIWQCWEISRSILKKTLRSFSNYIIFQFSIPTCAHQLTNPYSRQLVIGPATSMLRRCQQDLASKSHLVPGNLGFHEFHEAPTCCCFLFLSCSIQIVACCYRLVPNSHCLSLFCRPSLAWTWWWVAISHS